jgi:hypothetical protein
MKSTQNIKDLLDGDDVDYGEILRTVRRQPSQVFTRPIDETPAPARPDVEIIDRPSRYLSRSERQAETARRRQTIVEFIEHYFAQHFRPPTVREIGQGADISSTSMVVYHMRFLVAGGQVLDTGEHGENRRYVPAWLPDAIKREMQRRRGGK